MTLAHAALESGQYGNAEIQLLAPTLSASYKASESVRRAAKSQQADAILHGRDSRAIEPDVDLGPFYIGRGTIQS